MHVSLIRFCLSVCATGILRENPCSFRVPGIPRVFLPRRRPDPQPTSRIARSPRPIDRHSRTSDQPSFPQRINRLRWQGGNKGETGSRKLTSLIKLRGKLASREVVLNRLPSMLISPSSLPVRLNLSIKHLSGLDRIVLRVLPSPFPLFSLLFSPFFSASPLIDRRPESRVNRGKLMPCPIEELFRRQIEKFVAPVSNERNFRRVSPLVHTARPVSKGPYSRPFYPAETYYDSKCFRRGFCHLFRNLLFH